MNPRIKEIYEDACKEVSETTPSFLMTKDQIIEKFANLLIKECATLCCKDISEQVCTREAGKYFKIKIKKHFGVK